MPLFAVPLTDGRKIPVNAADAGAAKAHVDELIVSAKHSPANPEFKGAAIAGPAVELDKAKHYKGE